MKPLFPLILIVLLLASGCTFKPSGNGLSSSSSRTSASTFHPVQYPDLINGCLFTVCNANETSRDYKLVYEKLGMRQINFDPHRELRVGIEGDLVVWQIDRRVDGVSNADTYAYNISQDKLYAVGWEPYYKETLFELSHGRTVVKQGTSPEYPDEQVELPRRASIMLWDERTQERRIVETGLGGEPWPYGFDRSWVVFENSNNANPDKSGLFAMNVDTGDVIPLYVDADHPDFVARQNQTNDPTVVDGFAYYETHTQNTTRHFWLHEVNLTTREDRVVHEGDVYEGFANMRASGRYVVWYASFYNDWVLYVYDRVTGEGGPLTDRWTESVAPTFDVGGDWVVYRSSPPGGAAGPHPLVGIHIPTRTRVILVPDDPTLFPEIPATDGSRFVGTLTRNDYRFYDQNGSDLYWKLLPDVHGDPG